MSGRDKAKGQAVVDAIRPTGGSVVFVANDLSDAKTALELAASPLTPWGGGVDILVNNAGSSSFGPTASLDEATFDTIYGLNVKVPISSWPPSPPRWLSGGLGPS